MKHVLEFLLGGSLISGISLQPKHSCAGSSQGRRWPRCRPQLIRP